jgi:hypothetical protein
MPLPSSDNDPSLRSNLGKWAVPTQRLPAVAAFMTRTLTPEPWDSLFLGQRLETTYFDTEAWDLRKQRLENDQYVTLRVRCYSPPDEDEFYTVSVKTESDKFRVEIPSALAEFVLAGGPSDALVAQLPAWLRARLEAIGKPLFPVAQTQYQRYAVEANGQRYTLDVDITTDSGKSLHYGVLEYKAVDAASDPGSELAAIGLRPVKFSKFLWATEV